MRIIGGNLKGRKLHPIKGLKIRPTSDYLRESIFNILAGHVQDAVVLDLFAGTGGLGIEALSRGASSAVFVDKHRQAIEAVAANVSACSLQERCTIIRKDILRGQGFLRLPDKTFDLVFVDPPYDRGFVNRTLHLLSSSGCMVVGALVVTEHSVRETVAEKTNGLSKIDQRRHGKTFVSFYECAMKQHAKNGGNNIT